MEKSGILRNLLYRTGNEIPRENMQIKYNKNVQFDIDGKSLEVDIILKVA